MCILDRSDQQFKHDALSTKSAIHEEADDGPDRLIINTREHSTPLKRGIGLPRADGAPGDWVIVEVSEDADGHVLTDEFIKRGGTILFGRAPKSALVKRHRMQEQ